MMSSPRGSRRKIVSIDDLPPNVIQLILDRMPLRDAVRTCVLSKQWRDKWQSLSRLVFDENFFDPIWIENMDFDDIDDRVDTVYDVIVSQVGHIHEMVLHFPPKLVFHRPKCVKHWIQLAQRIGVKVLTLEASEFWDDIEPPMCLYSCLHLTHLSLSRLTVNPPLTFRGFPQLVSLTIYMVVEKTFSKLEYLISCCPELRYLELRFLVIPPGLPLCLSAPKLHHLFIYGDEEDDADVPVQFRVASKDLQVVSLSDGINSSNLLKLFASFQNVEVLELNYNSWKVQLIGGSVPPKLPILLPGLRKMILGGYDHLGESIFNQMRTALCLIRSAPNLQELQIYYHYQVESMPLLLPSFVFEMSANCSLKHLRIVKLRWVQGISMEFKLIKFLLACSPELEVMQLISMDSRDAKIKQRVKRYHRASQKAELIFS